MQTMPHDSQDSSFLMPKISVIFTLGHPPMEATNAGGVG